MDFLSRNNWSTIDEDIYSELQQNIDEILGDEVSEQLKEELFDELLAIIQQKKRQFVKNNNSAANYYNQQFPTLNLYVLSNPNIPFQSLPQSRPMMPPLQQQQQIQQPIMPLLQQQMQSPMFPFQPSMIPMNNFFIPQPYKRSPLKNNSKHSTKKKINKKDKKEKKEKSKEKQSKDTKKSTKKLSTTVLEYHPGKKFDGIIDYLTKKTGGNVHTNHTIEIKASSSSRGSLGNNNFKFIVDYQLISNYYQSGPEGNTTITFDFKERRVNVTHYKIRSMNTSNYAYQLRSWTIEGSNDEKQWTSIDTRSDDPSLKDAAVVSSFTANKDNKEFYRYIRLRQTGPSWSQGFDSKAIGLKMIDFYGSLQEPESKK